MKFLMMPLNPGKKTPPRGADHLRERWGDEG